jgi:hypothetical protein
MAALDESQEHPVVRLYLLLGAAGLAGLVIALIGRGLGELSLVPALVGAVALLVNRGPGPLVLLVGMLLMEAALARMHGVSGLLLGRGGVSLSARDAAGLGDLLLAAGGLAFCVAHARLQALLGPVFPPASGRGGGRRKGGPAAPAWPGGDEGPHPRPLASVGEGELARAALLVPVWCGVAFLLWQGLSALRPPRVFEEVLRGWARGLMAWWFLAAPAAAAALALAYRRLARASPEEARLYLQDQLWRETARDQDRLSRWLVWARLRAQRRRERR